VQKGSIVDITLRGTYKEKKAHLTSFKKDQLMAEILDDHYNGFLSDYADVKDRDVDVHGHGKRIPYIGWYWRYVNFSRPTSIPIGNCGAFIGFMANNKWDYPERNLTEEEAMKVIAIVDEAIKINRAGGNLKEIEESTHKKLDEIWDYMQTLEV
jgi:hypothetical protein